MLLHGVRLLLAPTQSVLPTYEALTLVRHETRYDMEHSDTTFLEKLEHDMVGIQPLIDLLIYIFRYILFIYRLILCLF